MGSQQSIILAVTNDLNYDQRMQRICSALVEFGFTVTLVGRQKRDSKPIENQPFNQKRLQCWFEKGALFYAEFNIRLFLWLLFQKFEIVTANDLDTVPACFLAGWFKRKKRVFDAHELYTETPELEGRGLVRSVWFCIEKTLVPRFHRHYTVSKSVGRALSKRLGLKFSLVYNVPLPDDRVSDKSLAGSSERYMIYQGAVNAGRGLEEVIDAMPFLDIKLKIAGAGDLFEAMQERVKKLGVEDKVEFLGYLRPAELREVTESAYIGLNLLKDSSRNYRFSLANKFFDYIIKGVPSINMDFIEYAIINKEHKVSLLLKDLSQQSIVNAVKKLVTDDHLYQTLITNCRKAAKLFNWDVEKTKLKEIYRFEG